MNTHIKLVKCNYKKNSEDHDFSASYYCSDCNLKICLNCLNDHNNFNKNHKIEDIKEIAVKCDLEISYLREIKLYLNKCNFFKFGIGNCINFRIIIGIFDKKFNDLTNSLKQFVDTIKPYEKDMKEVENEASNIDQELKKILEDPIYIKEYKRKNIRKNLIKLLNIKQDITDMFLKMDNLIAFSNKINKVYNEDINKLTDDDILLKLSNQENCLKKDLTTIKEKENDLTCIASNDKVYNDNIKNNFSNNQNSQIISNNVIDNDNINRINDNNSKNINRYSINDNTKNILVDNNSINENKPIINFNNTNYKIHDESFKENINEIEVKNNEEKKLMQETGYNSTFSLENDQNSVKTQTKNTEIRSSNDTNFSIIFKKFNKTIQMYNSKNKNEEMKNDENFDNNTIFNEIDETKNEIDLVFNQSTTNIKKHLLFGLSSNDENRHLIALNSTIKNNYYSIYHIDNKKLNYPQNFDKNYLNEFPYINCKIINLEKYSIIIGGRRKIDTLIGNELCYKLEFDLEKNRINISQFPNTKYKHQEHCVIYCQNYNSIIVLSGNQQKMCEHFCLNDNDEWKKFPSLPTPRKNAICFLFNERYIFIFGGKLNEKKNNQDYNVIDLQKVMKNKFELWRTVNINNNENFYNICKLFHPGLINMDKVVYILGSEKSHNIWKIQFKETDNDIKSEYYNNYFEKEKNIEINYIESCNNIKKFIKSDMNDLMIKNCLIFYGDEKFYKFDKKFINISYGGGIKYIREEDLKNYS